MRELVENIGKETPTRDTSLLQQAEYRDLLLFLGMLKFEDPNMDVFMRELVLKKTLELSQRFNNFHLQDLYFALKQQQGKYLWE